MVAKGKTEEIKYSIEEYLELEENSQFRNEYLNGEIKSMTGDSFNFRICL